MSNANYPRLIKIIVTLIFIPPTAPYSLTVYHLHYSAAILTPSLNNKLKKYFIGEEGKYEKSNTHELTMKKL
jgi:hypothetical protein